MGSTGFVLILIGNAVDASRDYTVLLTHEERAMWGRGGLGIAISPSHAVMQLAGCVVGPSFCALASSTTQPG